MKIIVTTHSKEGINKFPCTSFKEAFALAYNLRYVSQVMVTMKTVKNI